MNTSPPKLLKGKWRELSFAGVIWFFCSLLGFAVSPERTNPEKQELQVTIDLLREENAGLRKTAAARQNGLVVVSNRLMSIEWKKEEARWGLIADDDEARSAEEWRAFLLNALKILNEADQKIATFQKQLQMLVYAAKEAAKSAKIVNPSKRALLEGEIRQSEKILSGEKDPSLQAFTPGSETSVLSHVKIIGVRLDLGVAALAAGHQHGAHVGMPFLVLHDKTVLAVLTLAEVREKTSLALIEQMDPDKPIKEGDIAILRKS